MPDVILRRSNKEIHAKGGLLHFGKIITKLTSLESITRHLLPKGVYKTDDCIKAYLANLADAKSDFEAINNLKNDSICKKGFGITEVPSEETVRQRMDELSRIKTDIANITNSSLVKKQTWIINSSENNQIEANEVISELAVEFLKRSNAKISVNAFGYITVDIDTTTLDNSKTQKEGVEYTYRNFDGYSPIAAFIGEEGWNIGAELRPGSQHGQKNMDLFLQKIIDRANFLTPQNQLYRLDSAFDTAINFGILLKNKKDFIIKRNTGRRLVSPNRPTMMPKNIANNTIV